MIFSNENIIILRVKAVRFRFVAIKDFRVVGINIISTLYIPPPYGFFPK